MRTIFPEIYTKNTWGASVAQMFRTLCFWVVLLITVAPVVSFANEPSQKNPVVIGVFLTSLYELDSSDGTFSADIWIWSRSSKAQEFKLPLLEIGPLNGKFPLHTFGEYYEEYRESMIFSSKKIRGTFLHDYDLSNFPFDRQILKVILESTDESDKTALHADTEIGFDSGIKISGWSIRSVRLMPENRIYGSTFGYPLGNKNASYSSVVMEIEVERRSPLLFLKLTIGLFVAVLIAALSPALNFIGDETFSARLTLIAGSLLAAVFNQQFADAKTGENTVVTVVDSIHLVGVLTVGLLFLSTIFFRVIYLRAKREISLTRIDMLVNGALLGLFILTALILVVAAM